VWVVERRERAGFALEPRQALGVLREDVRQSLIATWRPRLVSVALHRAHPALTDLDGDLIRADSSAGREGHRQFAGTRRFNSSTQLSTTTS
jgi:hypothetical protein